MTKIIERKESKNTDYAIMSMALVFAILLYLIIFGFGFMLGHTKGISDGKIEVMATMESGAVYCVMNNMTTYHINDNFTITCQGVYPK